MVNTAAHEVVAEIYPETVLKRKLPVNFQEEHRRLFELDLERSLPPGKLVRLKNVRISHEGILFRGRGILPESFAFAWQLREWKARSVFKLLATNYLFRRRRRIDGEVLWITDSWSTSYFHWLTDGLKRLFAMRDRLNDQTVLLPSGYEQRDVVMSSLKAFGANKVDFIGNNEALECSSILMATDIAPSGHFRDETIQGVREILLSAFGDSNYRGKGERIYISRKRTSKRRIVNEDELTPILTKFGFQTLCMEDFSFEEQVKICSRARYIVSNHGAGLTNALFMRDGGNLLELRHQWERNQNCFFVMSSALNLNYFYQRCRAHDFNAAPHNADLIVDPAELEKTLSLLVA